MLVSGTNQIFVPIAETVTGAITSLPVTVAAGGTLALNNSVVGTFSLVKGGAGRLILGAGNAISGITAVTAGSLIVNGTNNQSTTQVQGGLIGGSGSIGPLNATSGTVSPGDNGAGISP